MGEEYDYLIIDDSREQIKPGGKKKWKPALDNLDVLQKCSKVTIFFGA